MMPPITACVWVSGFSETGGARQAVDDFLNWISANYTDQLRQLQVGGQVRADLDVPAAGRALASMLDGLVIHQALFPQADQFFAQTREAAISILHQGFRP